MEMAKHKLGGKPHDKAPLPRAIVLENVRYIGFNRTPVQEPDVMPRVVDLPVRQYTDYDA